MADRKPIVIHVFHEADGGRAQGILGASSPDGPPTYDGGPMLEATADEREIAALRDANLIVEVLPAPAEDLAQADRAVYRATARHNWSRSADGRTTMALPSGATLAEAPITEAGVVTVSTRDPTVDLTSLLGGGARILRALPGGVLVADLGRELLSSLAGSGLVQTAAFNLSRALAPDRPLTEAERSTVAPLAGEVREFDIIAHAPDRLSEIEAWVASHAGDLTRVGAGERKVRIRIADDSPLLDEANLLDAVFDVAVVPEARFCLDQVPALIGLPASAAAGVTLDGAGQTLGMTDGAVDLAHADFGGRVTLSTGPASPLSAHGTHVAGLMVGDATASGGTIKGVAPAARLVSQSLAVKASGALDLPVDLAQALRQSYADGARIHNLSFAEDDPQSLYSQRASELDAFAVDYPDMLLVVAAGNGSRSETSQYRPAGQVDLESVASPGIAKNVLTVGACCSSRASGGHPAATWAAFPPAGQFASQPTAGESVSGAADAIAAFSGRGWGHGTDRIKPDMVAPGTNIAAARASGVSDTLWGVHSADYLYSGGTSMAAPIVAASAALIRQHYANLGHLAPSSALLKATLAVGCDWLSGPGAAPAAPAPPPGRAPCANLDQGFGRINVARALALDGSGRTLCYVDVTAKGRAAGTLANGPPQPLTRDKETRRFWFNCGASNQPVDIALAYIDPVPGPAGAVLSLMVQSPGSPPRAGNDAATKALYPSGPMPDRNNNLQVVRLGPTQGKVEVLVSALSLQGQTVGFALVILGDVSGGDLYRY